MWSATETIEIAAAPEAVWAIVADIEGHPELAGSGEVRAVRLHGPVGPGLTFESDVQVGVVGSFVSQNRVEVFDPPRELIWKSCPPLDEGETEDDRIEVTWSFRLEPIGAGTSVEHRFEVEAPRGNPEEFAAFIERTDRIATVRLGMQGTLANLRSRSEGRR